MKSFTSAAIFAMLAATTLALPRSHGSSSSSSSLSGLKLAFDGLEAGSDLGELFDKVFDDDSSPPTASGTPTTKRAVSKLKAGIDGIEAIGELGALFDKFFESSATPTPSIEPMKRAISLGTLDKVINGVGDGAELADFLGLENDF